MAWCWLCELLLATGLLYHVLYCCLLNLVILLRGIIPNHNIFVKLAFAILCYLLVFSVRNWVFKLLWIWLAVVSCCGMSYWFAHIKMLLENMASYACLWCWLGLLVWAVVVLPKSCFVKFLVVTLGHLKRWITWYESGTTIDYMPLWL